MLGGMRQGESGQSGGLSEARGALSPADIIVKVCHCVCPGPSSRGILFVNWIYLVLSLKG